jgi:hypothetical protein
LARNPYPTYANFEKTILEPASDLRREPGFPYGERGGTRRGRLKDSEKGVEREMGRDHYVYNIPFLLWDREGKPADERLDANWEDDPEEWEEAEGWTVVGEGDIAGDTQWRKGKHAVEVVHACLWSRGRTYYAARDLASLEAWKRDHGLRGKIMKDEQVVHEG